MAAAARAAVATEEGSAAAETVAVATAAEVMAEAATAEAAMAEVATEAAARGGRTRGGGAGGGGEGGGDGGGGTEAPSSRRRASLTGRSHRQSRSLGRRELASLPWYSTSNSPSMYPSDGAKKNCTPRRASPSDSTVGSARRRSIG